MKENNATAATAAHSINICTHIRTHTLPLLLWLLTPITFVVVGYFLSLWGAVLLRMPPKWVICFPFIGFLIPPFASTLRYNNEIKINIALWNKPSLTRYALQYFQSERAILSISIQREKQRERERNKSLNCKDMITDSYWPVYVCV
jgi:hypothetical protein